MPELPEVQTIVSGLSFLKGWKISNVILIRISLRKDSSIPEDFKKRSEKQIIRDIQRIAKYIVITLGNEERIIIHLGMTGNLLLKKKTSSLERHDHIILELENNRKIVYHDPRRFGLVTILNAEEFSTYFLKKKIALDPLDTGFNTPYLKEQLSGRKSTIKQALLNQQIVAGMGNIYVCESLFMARISPLTPAGSISGRKLNALTKAMKDVLLKSIKAGGTTLKDYRTLEGGKGYFSQELQIYGREGLPCRKCKSPIKKIIQGGRSTFYCSKCQK